MKWECFTFYRNLFSSHFLPPIPPQGVQILLQVFCVFLLVTFLYITQWSTKSLIQQSMFLQIPFTYTRNNGGPKTLLAAHLRLLRLPWIVALLLWPFLYDLQGISLPKGNPSQGIFQYYVNKHNFLLKQLRLFLQTVYVANLYWPSSCVSKQVFQKQGPNLANEA